MIKALWGLFVGMALAVICLAMPGWSAEGDQAQIAIEKTAGDGAKASVAPAAEATASGTVTSAQDANQTAPTKATTREAKPMAEAGPHKARLAILPAVFSAHFKPEFKTSKTVETSGLINLKSVFTRSHETRWESPSFGLSLAEAFVGSRKFDVLERARLTEVLKEIELGESDYADVSRVVPMGKALNAEYVVLPEIEVVNLVQEIKDVPYVDHARPRLLGKMIARLRVVDTASTKIVAAFTDEVQVERKLKYNEPFIDSEFNNLVVDLYRTQSMRMLARTLEAIYPVRLVEVTSGKAILNRGEGAINAGDEFDVYTLGKAYVDPDTGASLGQSESKVARIKVRRVLPKFSEAEVLEGGGQLTGDLQRYLCRETVPSIEAKTKVARTPIAW